MLKHLEHDSCDLGIIPKGALSRRKGRTGKEHTKKKSAHLLHVATDPGEGLLVLRVSIHCHLPLYLSTYTQTDMRKARTYHATMQLMAVWSYTLSYRKTGNCHCFVLKFHGDHSNLLKLKI